jgi:predicted small lipoprotein YifL
MFTTRAKRTRRAAPVLGLAAGVLVGLTGCGQRGALYMPDRNARVVTRPAGAARAATASAPAASAPTSSAPSSAPR